MLSFSLSEYLTRFQTCDKSTFPEVKDPTRQLNYVIDSLASSPDQITDADTFNALLGLCQSFKHLSIKLQTQLTYLVASSLNSCAKEIKANIQPDTNYNELIDLIPRWKSHLEVYSYLVHILLFFQQEGLRNILLQKSVNKKGRRESCHSTNVDVFRKIINQVESLCESIISVFDLDLAMIFQTTPENDLFIMMFTRPLHSLMDIEATVKIASLKTFIQRIICLSVKNHRQLLNVQTFIMSDLTYFLHLSNFNAELLTLLNDKFNFSQLTEDVLKEISSRKFNIRDTTGPKSVSAFLVKLSELSPLIMLRQMSQLITLLNSNVVTLRSALVESCGNILVSLISDVSYDTSQRSGVSHQQIDTLIDLLEERFCDANPYVRTKAIQGCFKVISLEKPINSRFKVDFTKLAVRSLSDKSSLVRRNAIKLLSKLLLKHPFTGVHGDQLKLTDWLAYLNAVKNKIQEDEESSALPDDNDVHDSILDVENSITGIQSGVDLVSPTKTIKLKLLEKYYEDAVEFIEHIHKAINLVSALLFSKNRNEILEAMDFLVLTEAFNLEPSMKAIKKMLHLVWVKGTNDEGKSITTHLLDCYKQLFFSVPDNLTPSHAFKYIADNLIDITIGSSLSDLTSLEKLLCSMYKEGMITSEIINVLWDVYKYPLTHEEYNTSIKLKNKVHGSIIIIGMLALEDNSIISKGLPYLQRVGLDSIGELDLTLCKYTCIALQRTSLKDENSTIDKMQEEIIVKKIYSKIVKNTTDPQYYPMCEQALAALFVVSSRPDFIVSSLIKEKIMITFGKPDEPSELKSTKDISRITSLSQLLFIVGQVAVKTLVYIEKCEGQFKRRKLASENSNRNDDQESLSSERTKFSTDKANADELAMIGGTNEDDFCDAIQFIKEEELLFGSNSLLGQFCPLVESIVSNSLRFNDTMLQRTACLCLEKLMCISSKYCEKSLPLLITVMEKSPDPVVRSNAILGLGDMAVCFNSLVDENTDYLYYRLHDDDIMVQRTCLMTITFLILAGQVKVKGQLGEMAKCLENPDHTIGNMCRLFFTELAAKDNAIYNGFIDIFSNLSSDKALERDNFKKIMKFLISFIDKERHQRQLSEKLFARLMTCTSQEQWDDIAFVLNCIPYSDETMNKRLKEGFKVVKANQITRK